MGGSFVVVAVIGLSPNAPLLSIDQDGLPHMKKLFFHRL
jgi:hypothetical protein